MNKKIIVGVAIVLVVVIAVAVVFLFPRLSPEQQELDLTIRVESPEIYYIPFRTSADERWNLTIECLEMPSDLAWVTILHYNDYWDEGTDCRCQQEDLYSIATELTELQKIGVDPEIQQKYPLHAEYNTTVYTGIYGTSKAQSFTIFIPSPERTMTHLHSVVRSLDSAKRQHLTKPLSQPSHSSIKQRSTLYKASVK